MVCRTQWVGAHPRSRGENDMVGHLIGIGKGSSPLTRGKLARRGHRRRLRRLIPAHAGKTGRFARVASIVRAHPRSRGENRIGWGPLRGREGSSPLTRGKRGRRKSRAFRQGLIPAHAGKTGRSRTPQEASTAHPRSRGENTLEASDQRSALGSSPLTRGKRRPRL